MHGGHGGDVRYFSSGYLIAGFKTPLFKVNCSTILPPVTSVQCPVRRDSTRKCECEKGMKTCSNSSITTTGNLLHMVK